MYIIIAFKLKVITQPHYLVILDEWNQKSTFGTLGFCILSRYSFFFLAGHFVPIFLIYWQLNWMWNWKCFSFSDVRVPTSLAVWYFTVRTIQYFQFAQKKKKKTTNTFSIHYLFAVNLTFSRLLRRHAWISDSSRCAFGLTRTIRSWGNVGCSSNVVGQKKIVQKTMHRVIIIVIIKLFYHSPCDNLSPWQVWLKQRA